MSKIYAFCNIVHTREEEHGIRNHPIIAMDEDGVRIASHVSSNHSFGKHDIIHEDDFNKHFPDHDWVVEWVEDPKNHPTVSKLLKS